MSTTVEKISSNKVKLSFDIDAAKFDEAMGKAYIKVRGQVAIPGFRKGHAPRKMIENMYGEGVFYDEAFELIFDEVYGPAIDENKLEVVDRPQVEYPADRHRQEPAVHLRSVRQAGRDPGRVQGR